MRRHALLLIGLLALSACDEELLPATVVNQLRVLGVRAEPAELHPGDTALLSALVIDPSRPGQRNTLLWIGCDPDPFNLGRSACTDTTVLSDPTGFSNPGALPPGVRVIGFGPNAAYPVAADLFAPLDPEDLRRRSGVVGQVLLLAIAEDVSPTASQEELDALLERVRSKETASVLALFRLRVSEDPQVNTNPELGELLVSGAPAPAGTTLRMEPGARVPLELEAPESAREGYTQLTPDGEEVRTERLISAWYATEGRFEHERLALEATDDFEQTFHAPTAESRPALPENRRGTLWVVVRDTRGGQAWREVPIFYCDRTLPAPAGLSLESAEGNAGSLLTLRGENLESILEVLVGGQLLSNAGFSPGSKAFVGTVPGLEPGTQPITVRGKHCEDLPTGLTFTVK